MMLSPLIAFFFKMFSVPFSFKKGLKTLNVRSTEEEFHLTPSLYLDPCFAFHTGLKKTLKTSLVGQQVCPTFLSERERFFAHVWPQSCTQARTPHGVC